MADKPRLLYRDMRTRAETLLDEKVKKRVLKGLEALNIKYGENWVNLCDPDELDMGDATSCVLGQVYGDYDDGVRGLHGDVSQGWAQDHGFESDDDADVSYDDLDEAWLTVLAAE